MSTPLPTLVAAGAGAVELRLDAGAPPVDDVREELAQVGLEVAAVTAAVGEWDAAVDAASTLSSPLVIVTAPATGAEPGATGWLEHAERVVEQLTGLQDAAADGVAVAIEMPRRGTLTDTVENHRALSRLLVRHRLMLSADAREVAEVGLRVNELWRYFAARIAHIRLDAGGEEEASAVDLTQWKRLAAMYGYPGWWAVPGDELERAAAWADGRLAVVVGTAGETRGG
jgi:hypothetical protein